MTQLSADAARHNVLGRRIAYGASAIFVLLIFFVLDALIAEWAVRLEGAIGDLLRRGSIVPLLCLALILFGTVELGRLLHAKDVHPYTTFAQLMIAALVLTPWIVSAGWFSSVLRIATGLYCQVILLIMTMVGAGVLAVVRRNPEGTLRDMGVTVLMIVYLGFLGSFGVSLRCAVGTSGWEGVWLLLTAILITKASDIGAFFVGSAFGRHKLHPTVSPAKSVEGMVGGLAASALAAVLFAIAGVSQGSGAVHEGIFAVVWRATVFGLALSAAGQVGDLVESCFKRDAGIKDSGKVIPCFGGILDLIDSPVLAMPVAWFLLTGVWNVV